MNTHRFVVAAFVACLVPLIAAARPMPTASASAQAPTTAIKEIEVKAKKYDFAPNKIEIPLNTTVRFKITSEDAEHGFEIEGVKDSCVEIAKGETKTVEYKATKAGPVSFKCCHRCGLGHGGMKGTIVVK